MAKCWWNALLSLANRVLGAACSNRGLALLLLVACAAVIVGPWLRPPISCDFRGIHVPWSEASNASFLPEVVAEVPRPWLWGSVAVPLLFVVAAAVIVVLRYSRWTATAFGVLLALSLPAVAATLWSHPSLIEFFEGELRDRAMLRTVFHQHNEDMVSGGEPDRLSVLRGRNSKADYLSERHALLLPFRYLVYCPWLLGMALFGVFMAGEGTWLDRIAGVGKWTLAGLLLAMAVTLPRWLAEYHFARAESAENRHQFAAAEEAVERARAAMPRLERTRGYWLTKGRLGYRQGGDNQYVSFFLAHQSLLAGDPRRARATLEISIRATAGSNVQQDLLAEIVGQIASDYVSQASYSAAELAWAESADIAPWKSASWIAVNAMVLAADPSQAQAIERQFMPRLTLVGDRMVASDFSSLIGDAYFSTGQFDRARDMYSRAMDRFDLPKYVNLHAQEGRLGM
jgi:tetratricopeptide (TPR) repeat protein